MKKRYLRIGDLKRNAFIVAAAACMGLTSCGNNNSNDWNAGEEVAAPEGIITELTEEAPDQWKITDERTTTPGGNMAILKYTDGRVDTLQGLALENRMKDLSANQNTYNQGGFGLGSVLWWSGMGFMAGRMMSPRPAYYANPGVMSNTAAWRQNVQTYRQQTTAPRSGRSGFFRGRSGGAGA